MTTPHWQKTPTLHRILLCAAVLGTSALAHAQTATEPLTEDRLIRAIRDADPAVLAARARAVAAKAEVAAAAVYPNPSLAWERVQVPGQGSEDTLSLEVPIEWNGRRRANTLLAKAEEQRVLADAAVTESHAVRLAVGLFYQALAADKTIELQALAAARLAEAARIVGERHEQGSSSGYQRVRLELEAELAHSQARAARSEADAVKAELAALLGVEDSPLRLAGDLGTDERASAARVPLASQTLLHAAERAALEAARAARRGWLPELAVVAGLRVESATDTNVGYVAGLNLSLPLFSRGTELQRRASALAGVARAEATTLRRDRTVQTARARAALEAATEELTAFAVATAERVAVLEHAAESGYREGELSVVELVDAQRARVEIGRRLLALQLTAKLAELSLRAAQGEFE